MVVERRRRATAQVTPADPDPHDQRGMDADVDPIDPKDNTVADPSSRHGRVWNITVNPTSPPGPGGGFGASPDYLYLDGVFRVLQNQVDFMEWHFAGEADAANGVDQLICSPVSERCGIPSTVGDRRSTVPEQLLPVRKTSGQVRG